MADGAADALASSQAGEWRTNWPLVATSLAGLSTTTIAIYALGQFMAPLEAEFGWSRTEVSAGLSVSLALSFVLMPIVGRLVDRFNARLLAIPGLVLIGLSLASFSLATDNFAIWLGLWTIYAFANALIGPILWTAVISGTFDRSRSIAIALTLCGTNVGTALAPTAARLLLEEFGWRTAFQLLPVIWVGPALLLVLFFFVDRRDTSPARTARQATGTGKPPGMFPILLSKTFIRLALAVTISGFATAAYTIHLAPALVSKGLDGTVAATVAGVAGIATAAGKLATGSLFDRLGTGTVVVVLMALFALACALFALPSDNLPLAILASALIGMTAGGNFALLTIATAKLFGAAIFGAVYGVLISLSALSAAIGPLLASAVYDITGSYAPAFWAGIGVAIVTALLMQRLAPVSLEETPS
jgi:MFS family permease